MPVVAGSLTVSCPVKPPEPSAVAVAASPVWASPARPASVTDAPAVNFDPVTVTWSPAAPEAVPSWMARSLTWPPPSVAMIVWETGAGGSVTVQGVSSSMM